MAEPVEAKVKAELLGGCYDLVEFKNKKRFLYLARGLNNK